VQVYILTYEGGIRVGRRLTKQQVQEARAGHWEDVVNVELPVTRVHWLPECGGRTHEALARSIQDTTCRRCLMSRARQLRGWR